MVQVRKANPDDLDWLMVELKQFSDFFGSKLPLFGDEKHVRDQLLNLMAHHIVLIAEKSGGGNMGLIAGLLTPHLFNPKIRILVEMFWWVAPEHRGSRAGVLLFNEFLKWGKQNADWISCSIQEISPITDRIMVKHNFKLTEKTYLLEVG